MWGWLAWARRRGPLTLGNLVARWRSSSSCRWCLGWCLRRCLGRCLRRCLRWCLRWCLRRCLRWCLRRYLRRWVLGRHLGLLVRGLGPRGSCGWRRCL